MHLLEGLLGFGGVLRLLLDDLLDLGDSSIFLLALNFLHLELCLLGLDADLVFGVGPPRLQVDLVARLQVALVALKDVLEQFVLEVFVDELAELTLGDLAVSEGSDHVEDDGAEVARCLLQHCLQNFLVHVLQLELVLFLSSFDIDLIFLSVLVLHILHLQLQLLDDLSELDFLLFLFVLVFSGQYPGRFFHECGSFLLVFWLEELALDVSHGFFDVIDGSSRGLGRRWGRISIRIVCRLLLFFRLILLGLFLLLSRFLLRATVSILARNDVVEGLGKLLLLILVFALECFLYLLDLPEGFLAHLFLVILLHGSGGAGDQLVGFGRVGAKAWSLAHLS